MKKYGHGVLSPHIQYDGFLTHSLQHGYGYCEPGKLRPQSLAPEQPTVHKSGNDGMLVDGRNFATPWYDPVACLW